MRLLSILLILLSNPALRPSFAQVTALTVTEGGKTFTLYKVQKGDGWYGIARQFGISYAELRMANKNQGDGLEIGQMVRIPGKLKANDPYFQKNYIDSADLKSTGNIPVNPAIHIVDSKETLFSIAKRYNVTVEQVKKWNQLKSNSISVGQKLIINASESIPNTSPVKETKQEIQPRQAEKKGTEEPGIEKPVKVEPVREENSGETMPVIESKAERPEERVSIKPVPEPVSKEKVAESITGTVHRESKTTLNTTTLPNGRKEIKETGLATWIDDEQTAPNKYFALHKSAHNGTVIRITNRMNSRTVFVKVVGKLQSSSDDIVISVSKAAAEKLGVEDDRFQAELVYGLAPDE